MTIKTFWTLFLKILGIWLVLDSVSLFVGFFTGLFPDLANLGDKDYPQFAIFFIAVGIYAFILWLFVFKTTWVIDKLNLDKGFTEEKIELNIQHSTVLSIAIIVIGGLMFVDSLPQLCRLTFAISVFREDIKLSFLILHLVKTIIGYLLMTNSKFIVGYIDKQKTNGNDIQE